MLSVVWLALIHFKVTLKSLEKIVFLYLQVIKIYTYLDFIPNPMTYLYKYCIVFILYLLFLKFYIYIVPIYLMLEDLYLCVIIVLYVPMHCIYFVSNFGYL